MCNKPLEIFTQQLSADTIHNDHPQFVPYSPPPTKKGLVIDRPYSFYKVASPTVPQSVTVIDSPFGPPPTATTPTPTTSSPYNTQPGQNPFLPTPPQHDQHQRFHSQRSDTSAPQPSDLGQQRKDRPYPEDSIPATSMPPLTTVTMTDTMHMGMDGRHLIRERSNSKGQNNRAISPRPDKKSISSTPHDEHISRRPSDNRPSRSHSKSEGQTTGGREEQSAAAMAASSTHAPVRKGSGTNLFKIARQASDSAFRSVGLGRKSSSKNLKAEVVAEETPEQRQVQKPQTRNSQDNTTSLNRARSSSRGVTETKVSFQPAQQQPQDQEYRYPRTYDAELGRNRSLPDIKPPTSNNDQQPTRGSSLTNHKSNPGPFHSRQKSQHQLQTTTNATTTYTVQDAYGGTTDDWRQAQQAEKERLKLKDSSPTDRPGHTSINSVSTLNLPPTTTPPTSTANQLNRSTSRILLPDRDRANMGKPSETTRYVGPVSSARSLIHDTPIPEPTQENTSLAKATVQPGGILSQLQAATETGHVIDPAASIWSAAEGRYIQRSNTAPYPLRETRAIPEEDEAGAAGQRSHTALEYSKSEGYGAQLRHQRLQKKQILEQDSRLTEMTRPQPPVMTDTSLPQPPAHHHQPHNLQEIHDHHQQQRHNAISRARAMSNESMTDPSVDTNKDLPPTPSRGAQPALDMPPLPPRQPESRTQRQPPSSTSGYRGRSESQPESSRHRPSGAVPNSHLPSSGRRGASSNTNESALARSMSPLPQQPQPPSSSQPRMSHERTGSGTFLHRGASAGQPAGSSQKTRFGLDMLPLPVIPSPDETLDKNANLGILPQDVLRTLDATTVQRVITTSVIASRVYKVLTADEVERLKKEQTDLQKYVEALKVSLTIETRMRDASHSLIRLHENNTNIEAVKAATSQLHATTRKMDQIVQKSQHSLERLLVIQRMLLQHEGAVLNAGMRRLDAENRELSRTVIELETVRDKEKEEKLKWKKEHTQLRIQSMIFPNPPGLEQLEAMMTNVTMDGENGKHLKIGSASGHTGRVSPMQQEMLQKQRKEQEQQQQMQEQQQERLSALENYMKELNEEISKKDEKVQALESQLRLVQSWVDDFSSSTALQRIGSSENPAQNEDAQSSSSLQTKMQRLQTRIENEFRALETNAHDMKLKADAAEDAKNAALEFTAVTLANSAQHTANSSGHYSPSPSNGRASSSSPSPTSHHRRTRSRQFNDSYTTNGRVRDHSVRSRGPTLHDQGSNSDLNVVLNESLLELDLQLSMDHSNNNSNNRNNNRVTSSGTSSLSTSPTVYDQTNGSKRLSRNNSANGSRHQHQHQQQRQDLIRRLSRSKQRLEQHHPAEEPKDEPVVGDAHEEIKRLNAMVDELERIVRMKMQ
ncbi:hypothetical protein BG004_005979 [Podila humilis]|nr:hypothetical protein BG004_005979 [Podila humilis]